MGNSEPKDIAQPKQRICLLKTDARCDVCGEVMPLKPYTRNKDMLALRRITKNYTKFEKV